MQNLIGQKSKKAQLNPPVCRCPKDDRINPDQIIQSHLFDVLGFKSMSSPPLVRSIASSGAGQT